MVCHLMVSRVYMYINKDVLYFMWCIIREARRFAGLVEAHPGC